MSLREIWEDRKAVQQAIIIMVVTGLVALAVAVIFGGCAHQQSPAGGEVIVLPEREGTLAAKVAGVLVGQEPKAATVVVTVVFQPSDAHDPCLIDAHEGTHREDQKRLGTLTWLATYAGDYKKCRDTGTASAVCLRIIPLEKVAYDRQHACMAEHGGR